MAKTVLTEEDRRYLKAVALELFEIRRLLNQLTEKVAKMSDKELLKAFNATDDCPTERQLDRIQLTLQKQTDKAEDELRQ